MPPLVILLDTKVSDCDPGLIMPGHVATPGIRMPPSYNCPFPPFKRPSMLPCKRAKLCSDACLAPGLRIFFELRFFLKLIIKNAMTVVF